MTYCANLDLNEIILPKFRIIYINKNLRHGFISLNEYLTKIIKLTFS